MVDYLEEESWVRRHDLLYEALLSHRDKISLDVGYLDHGVFVTERGNTECTAAPIEEYYQSVDGFIAKGRSEVRANLLDWTRFTNLFKDVPTTVG